MYVSNLSIQTDVIAIMQLRNQLKHKIQDRLFMLLLSLSLYKGAYDILKKKSIKKNEVDLFEL